MWNRKYGTTEHICETKQTSRHRQQTCAWPKGQGEGWIGSLGLTDANQYL